MKTQIPTVTGSGWRNAGVLALAAAVIVTAAGFAGCAKPLLSPRDERSPFDRYDAIRNQYARQVVEDEYGRERPNLRGRLAPK